MKYIETKHSSDNRWIIEYQVSNNLAPRYCGSIEKSGDKYIASRGVCDISAHKTKLGALGALKRLHKAMYN